MEFDDLINVKTRKGNKVNFNTQPSTYKALTP